MGGPDVALVFLQAEEIGDLFRIAYPFECPHVLAGGNDEGPFDLVVDTHHMADDDIFNGHVLKFDGLFVIGSLQRLDEIALEHRRIGNGGNTPGRNLFLVLDEKVLLQVLLGQLQCQTAFVHEVKGIEVLEVGIDAVSGKTATKAVAPVMHEGDGLDDHIPFHQLPRFGDEAGQAAVGDIFLKYMGRFHFHSW